MPRLRQPATSATNEPFDSTKVQNPVEEEKTSQEPQLLVTAEPPEPEEVVIEEPKKPERVEAKEPKKDDASIALQQQIERLRQTEALARQAQEERDRAQKETRRAQRDTLDAQEDTLKSSIQQANSDADKIQLEIERAIESGDSKAQVDAQRRLARAEARMLYFEEKVELVKEQRRELKKERQRAKDQRESAQFQPQQNDPRELPHIVAWRQAHPEFFSGNRAKAAQLTWAFEQSQEEGLQPYSVAQVERINELLGLKESGQPDSKMDTKPDRSSAIMSAPVSREIPSGGSGQRQSGKITLTKEELEYARISGVTPAEYARQKAVLAEMKANGEYGERR